MTALCQVAAYRHACTYQLWQLHSLAKDSSCRERMLGEGAPAMLARLLPDKQLAEGAATVLQRLATADGSQAVMHAGGHKYPAAVMPLLLSGCYQWSAAHLQSGQLHCGRPWSYQLRPALLY